MKLPAGVPPRELLVLAGICGLGACVRIAFLREWAAHPLFSDLTGDELNFHETALALLGRGELPEGFFYQPLASFWLACAYLLFGTDTGTIRVVQLALGLAGLCALYALGLGIGGREAGRLSALLGALYGPFVFFEAQLLAPALAVPTLAGALALSAWAGLRGTAAPLLPAGVLAGLAALARPNLLVVLPVAGVWWLRRIRARGWRTLLAGVGLAAAGLVVGVLPAWIPNATWGMGRVPISASGGHSFFIGNNPDASGLFYVPPGIDGTSHTAYRRSWVARAEEHAGRSLDLAEVSSYWLERGLDWWRAHPGDALALTGRKLLMAFNSEEMPIQFSYAAAARVAPVLGWLLPFGALLPFGLLALWSSRHRPGVWMLGAALLAYQLGLAAFYVADRYRVFAAPMLIPLAAVGVLDLAGRIRERGASGILPPLLLLAAGLALTFPDLRSEEARARDRYKLYNLMGKMAARTGALAAAEGYFSDAIAVAGARFGAQARINLGMLLQLRGAASERVVALYEEGAALDATHVAVRRRLARHAERAGDLEGALRWWRQVAALSPDPSAAEAEVARLESLGGE